MRLSHRTIALGLFAVLMAAAMLAYPGGTSFDETAKGHHFWHNFLCNLFSGEALNGESNRVGSLFAVGAMAVVILGVVLPIWWHNPLAGRLTKIPTLTKVRRVLGIVATISTLVLCVELALGSDHLHGVATILAGSTGLIATLLSAFVVKRAPGQVPWFAIVGVLAFGTTALNLVMYGNVEWSDWRLTPALPTVQKIAAFLLMLWFAIWPESRS